MTVSFGSPHLEQCFLDRFLELTPPVALLLAELDQCLAGVGGPARQVVAAAWAAEAEDDDLDTGRCGASRQVL
jgi:hypothetical protein